MTEMRYNVKRVQGGDAETSAGALVFDVLSE